MTEAAHPGRAVVARNRAAAHRTGLNGAMRWVLRDAHLAVAMALSVPLLVMAGHRPVAPVPIVAIVIGLLAAQLALGAVERRRRAALQHSWAWPVVRGLVTIAAVGLGQLTISVPGLLSGAHLTVVAIVAGVGRRAAMWIICFAVATQLLVELADGQSLEGVAFRTVAFAAIAVVVAFASQRQVRRLREIGDRLRRAITADRRRARQIGSVEAVGRILATSGPTPDALDRVVTRISEELGLDYVSIYLARGSVARLGAQHGYEELVEEFDGSRGIVGRVMKTRKPALIRDVTADPDYWSLNSNVRSEICAPFLADGEFLGFINVESTVNAPLDRTDLRVVVAIADRLAASMVIGRERQQLAERAELFGHLHEFGEAIGRTLEAQELYDAITRACTRVVPASAVALTVLDSASGRYLVRSASGESGQPIDDRPEIEVRPGKGMAGRAIRQRTLILDDNFDPAMYPALGDDPEVGVMRAAAVPLLRTGGAIGALTFLREPTDEPFSLLDQDALAMLAGQAALAISNALLHAEMTDLAIRDPLTGLFNRRYLDPALEQVFARRDRQSAHERTPLAAVMFDLDHFSELNNRYGHQVGDEVLRRFGGLLASRMRATDLVGRYGGEEFVAVMYRATLEDAMRVAEDVREQFAAVAVRLPDGQKLTATVSAGCSAISPEIDSAAALVRAADVALYMAKRAGRDRVVAA